MSGQLRWFVITTVLLAPSAGLAQLQVNQTFLPQGPAPSIGALDVVQSGDVAPNGTVAGAVQAILPDPALGSGTIFLGSPNGGIWRSKDGGTSWTSLTDNQASLSIASLALDPTDTSGKTLIAGIGLTSNGIWDAFNRADRAGSGGQRTGLLYSTDGGISWTSLGGAQLSGQSVIGVAAAGQTMLAATFEEQGATVTTAAGGASYGLYRSVNGGTSFALVSGAMGSGLPGGPVTALVADPRNSATCGAQNSCTYYAGVTSPANPQAAGVYVSNNSGQTWSAVFTSATAVSGGTNYIAGATDQLVPKLATGPNGSVAIAIANNPASGNQKLQALYLSQNGGASWSALAVPVVSFAPVNQAVVNLAVAIDPNNTSIVYVAGDGLQVSPFTITAFRVQGNAIASITDGNTSNNSTAHSDARTLTFDANGNLLMGSDGGIYVRSNPEGNNGAWTGLNSSTLDIREPNEVAYGANARRFIVAAQDTGIAIQSAPNSALYNAIQGADGVNVAVSDKTFANMSVYYNSYYDYGGLARLILDSRGNPVSPGTAANGVPATCNGGQDCASVVVGEFFSSPIVINKVNPTHLALAGGHVYVTTDTAPANATSVDLTLTDLGATHGSVTALAYGTIDNPNVVLAGNNSANGLYLSTTGAANSIAPIHGFAGQVPTSLVFDQRSQNRFYVADSFDLWGTSNQGGAFQKLSGNLPANIIQPTSVEFINTNGVNALLVGGLSATANAPSQIAVADSDASGNLSGWRNFGSGLPNALISQMSYNSVADVLAMSAVGRGVWALYDVTSYFPQATTLQFGLADNDSMPDASFLTNGTSASRPLIKYGAGTLTIAGNATYTGGTTINDGMLVVGTGGASGSIIGNVTFCGNAADPACNATTNKFLAFDRSDTYTFAGAIAGPGQVLQVGSGTTILTGTNTYTGPTTIGGGTLEVDGSIAASSLTSVNVGGALTGIGTIGAAQINAGGILAPGGAMTIAGNLAFQPGAFYLVSLKSTDPSIANVTGAASLAGIVAPMLAPGSLKQTYDILHATGGLGGTTFDGLMAAPNLSATLSYSATDAFLDLTAALGSGGGLNQNQQNIANTINAFFNNGGVLPPGFAAVFARSGAGLSNALSQLAGEPATGAQSASNQMTTEFLTLMLDPFVRGGGGGTTAMPFAAGQTASFPPELALAYASILKAPQQASFDQRWTLWGASYGGLATLDGNATAGSNTLSADTFGFAAGADYRAAPDLVVGFALAGGGTSWSLAQGLGGGRSDALQAGLYGTKDFGRAYVAAALAFTDHWFTTNRTTLGDALTANFNAQSFGGRVEAGYRYAVAPTIGVAPYAALQAQSLHLPAYRETDPSGGGLGLIYNATTANDTRGELGARVEDLIAYRSMPLILRARLAWAHDWVSNPAASAVFQALPGASFIVNGAPLPHDTALASAGAELHVNSRLSVLGKFDGEFATGARTYAGTGTVRYAW